MSIPIYREHILQAINDASLKEIFSKYLGECPIVIHITHLRSKQDDAIRLIEDYVVKKEIPYLFPYPLYIVTSLENQNSIFQTFKTRNDLPEYYGKKEKKPNLKESQIIRKNKLYQNKIRTHLDQSMINFINEEAVKQKYLFDLTKEAIFYEELMERLNNPRVPNESQKK